jgi:hypothetical protein
MFSLPSFKQDAAIVKEYTGATLTREQFNSYKKDLSLTQKFGSRKLIHREYYGFGIPMQLSTVDVMSDVLRTLTDAGVTFNIEQNGANELLFNKLRDAARICLSIDNWPRISAPYKESPRLIEAVRQIRTEMKLTPLEAVL